MTNILTNTLLGLLLGTGAVVLKLPLTSKTPVRLSSYAMFFIGGFVAGFLLIPTVQISKTYVLSLVLHNPMIFTTKAFKLVVAVGTAAAFVAGFKLGKWEI